MTSRLLDILGSTRVGLKSGRLPIAVMAVLLLVALWFVAELVWQLTAPKTFVSPDMNPVKVTSTEQVRRVAGGWFSGAQTQAEQKALKKAKLKADLLGVTIAGKQSLAAISTPANKTGVYRIGDTIKRGVEVKSIEPTRVVIRENGELRQIEMKKLESKGKSRLELTRGVGLPSANTTPPPASNQQVVSRAISSFNEKDLATLGLTKKDVFLKADGLAIDTITPQQLRSFIGRGSIPVTVMRDGREQVISVDTRKVMQMGLPLMNNN